MRQFAGKCYPKLEAPVNVFDLIEELEHEDATTSAHRRMAEEESSRQATFTYPNCSTKKCPGKIRTVHQTATKERPAMCVSCLHKFASLAVKV